MGTFFSYHFQQRKKNQFKGKLAKYSKENVFKVRAPEGKIWFFVDNTTIKL